MYVSSIASVSILGRGKAAHRVPLLVGYRVPILHLNQKVGVLERGFDALLELLISIFEHEWLQLPLDGVRLRVARP